MTGLLLCGLSLTLGITALEDVAIAIKDAVCEICSLPPALKWLMGQIHLTVWKKMFRCDITGGDFISRTVRRRCMFSTSYLVYNCRRNGEPFYSLSGFYSVLCSHVLGISM